MKTFRYQRGVTAIGWTAIIALVMLSSLIIMKLLPIYIGGYETYSIINGLKGEPDIGKKKPQEIRKMILKRLDINMVNTVSKSDIFIERGKNSYEVEIDYEVRKNMFGNLDIVVYFNPKSSIPIHQ